MTRKIFCFLIVGTTLLWQGSHGLAQQAAQPARPQAPAAGQAAPNVSSVTKEQFERWTTELSNWGRWGKDDQRGALNLITDDKRKKAAALVKTGTTVSLSHQIVSFKPEPAAAPQSPQREGATHYFAAVTPPDGQFLFERQEIAYHGSSLSHFDALCHVAYKGQHYNGFVSKEIVTMDGGCSKLDGTSAKDGIVTRGILLDIPNTRVRPSDIEAWEKKTGVKISSGDALLLRTKLPGGGAQTVMAGYDPEVIPFLKQRDVALLGSDGGQEGGNIPGVTLPMHFFTLVTLGLNLMDNLALDDLADTAARLKRWEFMLVVSPLRMKDGAGSPINAVAIF